MNLNESDLRELELAVRTKSYIEELKSCILLTFFIQALFLIFCIYNPLVGLICSLLTGLGVVIEIDTIISNNNYLKSNKYGIGYSKRDLINIYNGVYDNNIEYIEEFTSDNLKELYEEPQDEENEYDSLLSLFKNNKLD